MKKSIGDNMIPDGWSFADGLELVKRAGYDGIELWLGAVPWFQMSTTDAQVKELRLKWKMRVWLFLMFQPASTTILHSQREIPNPCPGRSHRRTSARSGAVLGCDAILWWLAS